MLLLMPCAISPVIPAFISKAISLSELCSDQALFRAVLGARGDLELGPVPEHVHSWLRAVGAPNSPDPPGGAGKATWER